MFGTEVKDKSVSVIYFSHPLASQFQISCRLLIIEIKMTHEFIVGTSSVEVLAPIDMSLKFEARRRCFVKALRPSLSPHEDARIW